MYTRVRELPNFKDVDVLFLGSSHAYRGFDTRLFEAVGLKSFNLGSSSQTPIQTRLLLSRYLDQLNPKIVVYEVYPNTFCVDGVEASTDIISNDVNDWRSLLLSLNSKNIKVFNTFLYALTKDVFNLNSEYSEPINKPKNHDTYISGGYIEKEMAYYSPVSHEANHWEFRDDQISEFESILKELDRRSIKTYLVFNPMTSNYYNSYDNRKEFNNWMSGYGNYINYNEVLNLNDSLHFYDDHHMNQDGVEICNQKLVELLLAETRF
jgi:hypothetical protein